MEDEIRRLPNDFVEKEFGYQKKIDEIEECAFNPKALQENFRCTENIRRNDLSPIDVKINQTCERTRGSKRNKLLDIKKNKVFDSKGKEVLGHNFSICKKVGDVEDSFNRIEKGDDGFKNYDDAYNATPFSIISENFSKGKFKYNERTQDFESLNENELKIQREIFEQKRKERAALRRQEKKERLRSQLEALEGYEDEMDDE